MDCDEPHLALNEKTQPIQWTKWPTGALVAVGSFWAIRNLIFFGEASSWHIKPKNY